MDELIEALHVSQKITVIRTEHGDFLDYGALFKVAYNDLKGLVNKKHIFTCDVVDNDVELWMSIRETDLEDCALTKLIAMKRGRRSAADLEAHMNQLLKPITSPGINPYKLVELHAKYRPVVPEEYWEDELYLKPDNEVLKKFKEEKVIRKDNREKVKAVKEGDSVKGSGGDGIEDKINEMNVAQLKLALESYGFTIDGLKADLRARLNAHQLEESNSGGGSTLPLTSRPTCDAVMEDNKAGC